MANTDTKMTRQEKMQIATLVVICIIILTLIVAIITLIKNADEIRDNPVDYAIKHTSIEFCTCYNDEGDVAYFGEIIYSQGIINISSLK